MESITSTQRLSQNKGFHRMFSSNELTVGLILPVESYHRILPTMRNHISLAQRAEELGFSALWLRDIPLFDPSFGDAGQIFDPWVYLGYLAAQTKSIILATGSLILPLRHPLHLAKSAASVDQLSEGRLLLGVASGDRPIEFPAFGVEFDCREEYFQETLYFFKQMLEEKLPRIHSPLGIVNGTNLLPRPVTGRIPLLVTGYSRQSLEWIAMNADGWLYYLPTALRKSVLLRNGVP